MNTFLNRNKVVGVISAYRFETIYSVFFSFILLSSFVERLDMLGNPNLAVIRFCLSALMLTAFAVISYKHGLLSRIGIHSGMAAILFMALQLWINMATMYMDYSVDTFFLLYIFGTIPGYFFGKRERLVLLTKLIVFWALIAGVIGWIFFTMGREGVQAIGIGENAARESGGFVALSSDDVDLIDLVSFRSFSLFQDHQAFSAYMQFACMALRIRHFFKPSMLNLVLALLVALGGVSSLSTTGIGVSLAILLTFLPIQFLIVFVVTLAAIVVNLYWMNPDAFQVFVHIDSLEWRLEYISRAIDGITWLPQATDNVWFTSDCYLLWFGYKYGAVWIALILAGLLAVPWLAGKISLGNVKIYAVFFLFITANLITNGLFTSTPLNVIMPLYYGMMLKVIHENSASGTNAHSAEKI